MDQTATVVSVENRVSALCPTGAEFVSQSSVRPISVITSNRVDCVTVSSDIGSLGRLAVNGEIGSPVLMTSATSCSSVLGHVLPGDVSNTPASIVPAL